MPEVDKDRKQALIDDAEKKDLGLKEKFKQEEEYKKSQQRALRKKIQSERIQQEILSDKHDSSGKKKPYWALVDEKATEFTEIAGQMNYVEFGTCMMDLLGMLNNLAKHLAYSKMNLFSLITDKGIWLWEQAKDKLTKEKPLAIEYSFHINAKGLLETSMMRNGETYDTEEKRAEKLDFDTFFVAWLKIHGIECSDEGRLTKEEGHAAVTLENLYELEKAHPFTAFLKERADVNATLKTPPPAPTL